MTIYQDNVLDWATAYDGPPFHAVLCDPPYGLNEQELDIEAVLADWMAGHEHCPAGRGFMGKAWDSFIPGPAIWRAVRRCCHPGALLFAFGGTRTADLLALALRLAGWIKVDEIDWVYGCLSEDTEILTADGWEPYHKSIENKTVMCYNPDTDALEWHRVQELVAYDYDETAYRIHSANTDQLVSRNHRCLVERDGRWAFVYAEHLGTVERVAVTTEAQIQTPKAIPTRKTHGQGNHVPSVRHTGIQATGLAAQNQNGVLLGIMPIEARACCAPAPLRGQWQGQKATGQRADWRTQSSLEGRCNLLQKARELRGCEVCALPSRVYQHGPQGWVCDGTSPLCGSGDRTAAAALRGGASQGSQSRKQRSEQPAFVCKQPRSQALRTSRIAQADLAAVTPIHYRGVVWCVRVPTGAFVARRNGHIFITGNSGFPKNHNIGKAMDRRAGAAGEVVGQRRHQPKFDAAGLGYREKDNGFNDKARESFDVTAPASPEGQTWAGHGTALKPAHEPILVFRNPFQGTYAANCAATGAGALWIEGGRIGSAADMNPRDFDDSRRSSAKFSHVFSSTSPLLARNGEVPNGRWPTNLILQHSYACGDTCAPDCPVAAMDRQSGESTSGVRRMTGNDCTRTDSYTPDRGSGGARGHSNSGGASRFFFCADWALEQLADADPFLYAAKASRSEREAGLDPRSLALLDVDEDAPPIAERTNTEALRDRGRGGFGLDAIDDGRATPIDNPYQRGETQRRNIHPTVKPIVLTRYLASLLLPPAHYAPRRLLVPFAGVFSEGIGAELVGWEEVIGVELEEAHCRIAEARRDYWQQLRPRLANLEQPVRVRVSAAEAGQLDMFSEAA